MTRKGVKKVLIRLHIAVVGETVDGIEIRRSGRCCTDGGGEWHRDDLFGVYIEQIWRLQCGGGIAGNSGVWWLHRRHGVINSPPWGPFATQRQLTGALRRWRKFDRPAQPPAGGAL